MVTLTCRYRPCSKEFTPNHPRQEFCEPTCRANQHYLDHPEKGRVLEGGALRSVATHPVQAVREDQAVKKHNRDLGGLIRQAIIDRIKTTGECFADDLVGLYPANEVKECRRLATAQFGSLTARGLIREKERRKSSIPERKGAKSGVYTFTKAGWDRWGTAGVSADGRCRSSRGARDGGENPYVSTHSGDSDLTGPGGGVALAFSQEASGKSRRDVSGTASPDNHKPLAGVDGEEDSQRAVETVADRGASVHSGESSSAGQLPGKRDKGRTDPPSSAGAASPEPLSLLPEPDPKAWAA